MKRNYILIFAVILLLSGCAKKAQDNIPSATPAPTVAPTAAPSQKAEPKADNSSKSQAPENSNEKQPTFEEFQNLTI
jgi:PBP1b-binding outer membrane lipoprotein LpoB